MCSSSKDVWWGQISENPSLNSVPHRAGSCGGIYVVTGVSGSAVSVLYTPIYLQRR